MCKYGIIFFVIFLFGAGTIINGQSHKTSNSIVGVWQVNHTVIAAGYDKLLIFYSNGKFAYRGSEMEYLSRLAGFTGTYKVQDTQVDLSVSAYRERVGGRLTDAALPEGVWSFTNDTCITYKIKPSDNFNPPCTIVYNKNGKIEKLKFNFQYYYLIKKKPESFD